MDQAPEVRSVLAVLTSGEEQSALGEMLPGAEWDVRFAPTLRDAERALRSQPSGIVVSNARLADGSSWKDLLDMVQRMPVPPQFIVADRLADDALWAEVLNLGAYDLLTTPFVRQEVLRVLPMAWDFRRREIQQAASRRKKSKPAPAPPRTAQAASGSGAGAVSAA